MDLKQRNLISEPVEGLTGGGGVHRARGQRGAGGGFGQHLHAGDRPLHLSGHLPDRLQGDHAGTIGDQLAGQLAGTSSQVDHQLAGPQSKPRGEPAHGGRRVGGTAPLVGGGPPGEAGNGLWVHRHLDDRSATPNGLRDR